MAYAPFDAPRLKVVRAKSHIDDASNVVSEFLARRPFRLMAEPEPDLLRRRLVFRVVEEPPAAIPLIVGDAIHNMRAALDLLACDLVRLNGGKIDGVYFPFCRNADGMEDVIKMRKLYRAAPHIVDAIRALKPYKGGNVALRAIHDLDVMDKHEMIIPLGNCAAFDELPPDMGITTSPNVQFGPVQDGFAPFAGPASPLMPLVFEVPARYTLIFGPLVTSPGLDEVIPTLHGLAQLVTDIVEQFETLCSGQARPSLGTP